MHTNLIKTTFRLFVFAALLTSCLHRELESEHNYVNLKREESIKDNEILRFRTFSIKDSYGFLIFGNNNEVSIDGSAQFPLYTFIDDANHQSAIDLTGCIYEYTSNADEILFKEATLRSKYLKAPLLMDVLFYFAKATDGSPNSEKFDFRLKKIVLPGNTTLSIGEKLEIGGQTIGFMTAFNYTLVYYRN